MRLVLLPSVPPQSAIELIELIHDIYTYAGFVCDAALSSPPAVKRERDEPPGQEGTGTGRFALHGAAHHLHAARGGRRRHGDEPRGQHTRGGFQPVKNNIRQMQPEVGRLPGVPAQLRQVGRDRRLYRCDTGLHPT